MKAIDILLVVVALKLKNRVDELPLSKTIKDLVGGKSTLQNEILGDLQQEFASAPEKGKEFLSRSWVLLLAVASKEAWASTAQVSFRALSVARCLVVSTPLP